MKVYSRDEETYYELDEVLQMMHDDGDLYVGAVIHEGNQVQRVAGDYLHGVCDTISEQLADAAWEEAGEFAEDWPEIPLDKKLELEKLIGDWLTANVPVNFWTVRNVKEIEVTAEMVAEHRS